MCANQTCSRRGRTSHRNHGGAICNISRIRCKSAVKCIPNDKMSFLSNSRCLAAPWTLHLLKPKRIPPPSLLLRVSYCLSLIWHPDIWGHEAPHYHHKAQMSCHDYRLTWWLHTVLNFLIFKMTAATAQASEATTRDGITFDLFQQFLQLRFHHIRLCGSVRLCCLIL